MVLMEKTLLNFVTLNLEKLKCRKTKTLTLQDVTTSVKSCTVLHFSSVLEHKPIYTAMGFD